MTVDIQERIGFEPVTGNIGALVSGVPLDASPSQALTETLRLALHTHGVLFFDHEQMLSASEFLAFSRLFGEAETGYQLTISDAPQDAYLDSDRVPMKDFRINCWHTDGTALERPPRAAMLTPVELPRSGGDTMWASMPAAWEALSSATQRLLEGLEVLHSTARTPFLQQTASTVHPAVIRDPVTGRKVLYVNSNYSERFLGMSDAESEALLRMLFDHINTPEFHVRLRWRPGTVAVWDERGTQHRGVADFTGPRKLRRLTFAGDRPSA
jgi:taurine dioxygenase